MPRSNQTTEKLKRSLPLYGEIGFTERQEEQGYERQAKVVSPHPGLVFDKYIDTWNIDKNGRCGIQGPKNTKNASEKLKLGSKRAWLEETIGLFKKPTDVMRNGLNRALEYQARIIDDLKGRSIPFKTDWRFVSGLGNGHPFETGFIFHRTLGVPYLPGSSVKGLLRAWADPRLDKDKQPQGWGDPKAWAELNALFGDTDDHGAGRLIIFDALPIKVPELELDIMNPHYGEYYSDSSKPPADYLSPVPVFFMAVKPNQPFQFSIAPRPGAYEPNEAGESQKDADLKRGVKLLSDALRTLGAGGKTAVGYGQFSSSEKEQSGLKSDEEIWEQASLKWTKGNKTLTVRKGRESTQCRLMETKQWSEMLGALGEEQRNQLMNKREITASVTVERLGSKITLKSVR